MADLRTLLRASGMAALFVLAIPVGADAGVGPSTICNDGTGGGIPILNTGATLNVEVNSSDVWVCYSTTEPGNGAAAVTGGTVRVLFNGSVTCFPDTSPVFVGVNCQLDDRNVWVRVTVQGVPVELGIRYDRFDNVVCLRDAVVTTPTGSTPPLDIGVCV